MAERLGKWCQLEVAIEGDGLSPRDVNVRHLAELLQATAAAVEAVAHEQGIDPPELRLIEIRDGSAEYHLLSKHPDAPQVFREFYHAAKTRGKKSSNPVKHALSRMHHASRIGSIRIVPRDAKGVRRAKPIHLAPPLEEVITPFDATTEVYGRVAGVVLGRGETTHIRLRIDGGSTQDFDADADTAESAAKLFGRHVKASVTYNMVLSSALPARIERVALWDNAEFLDVIRDIRDDIAGGDVEIDASAWLAELDEAARD